jgi:hypothetical protein
LGVNRIGMEKMMILSQFAHRVSDHSQPPSAILKSSRARGWGKMA